MKNIIKYFFSAFALLFVFSSCEKNENKIFFEGGTPPSLTASRSGTIPLSFAMRNQEAIKLTWTNPEYRFTTGISSQDVSYVIEIDTTGANFTNPKRQTISVGSSLSRSFTVAQINDYLLNQLKLDSLRTHNIEIRVTSTIGGAVPMYSNVLRFSGVKPYAIPPKVTPPAAGTLFITGSATPASWMGNGDAPLASQQFTKVSNTLYVLNSINLNAGGSYLFVPRYGNWSPQAPDPEKYGYDGANNANNVNGDDFKAFGGDMKAPPIGGAYKIEVDFQTGKFTLTKL